MGSSTHSKERKLRRVPLKEELVALTGDGIAALVLQQLLWWSERVRDFDEFLEEERQRNPDANVDPTHGWIYKTAEDVARELMGIVSKATINRRIKDLVEKGWVDCRENPKHKWDRTLQYRLNIRKIQLDLWRLGYPLSDYPLQFSLEELIEMSGETCISQTETSKKQTEGSKSRTEKAIPQNSTQNSTQIDIGANAPSSQTETSSESNPSQAPMTLERHRGAVASEEDPTSKEEFEELFGPAPPPAPQEERPEGMTVEEWHRQRAARAMAAYHRRTTAEGWLSWGAHSEAANRQFSRLDGKADDVRYLGARLEERFGMVPVWGKASDVKSWIKGLVECLDVAGGDRDLPLRAARKLIEDGLIVNDPWSLVKTTRALAAEARRGKAFVERKAVKTYV